jgi:Ca2+-binding RTX toxin-like protein
LAEAVRTLGPGFKPSGYTFVGGSAGEDYFDRAATTGPDVFCGFGGNDSISTLEAGDIFLGGDGNDTVFRNFGTFYGGAGKDYVYYNQGTFYGEAGNDYVLYPDDSRGTFYQ